MEEKETGKERGGEKRPRDRASHAQHGRETYGRLGEPNDNAIPYRSGKFLDAVGPWGSQNDGARLGNPAANTDLYIYCPEFQDGSRGRPPQPGAQHRLERGGWLMQKVRTPSRVVHANGLHRPMQICIDRCKCASVDAYLQHRLVVDAAYLQHRLVVDAAYFCSID